MRGKAEAIIKAASTVFLSRGFAAANMDEIAAVACVSKRTIYKHFESKEKLFSNIIVQSSSQLMQTLDTSLRQGSNPRETLTNLARSYLDLILSTESLETYRLVISESARFPALAAAFYASGSIRVSTALASYLAEWHANGAINVPDPEIAADQFMGSCVGPLRLRALFDPGSVVDKKMIGIWVDSAVERFLAGIGYNQKD